jgi:hypothetical protein
MCEGNQLNTPLEIPVHIENLMPLIAIEVYTHFFKIVTPSNPAIAFIEQYVSRNLTQRSYIKDPVTRQGKWATVKTFAIKHRSATGGTYRLHRHCLEDFLESAIRSGFPKARMKITEVPIYEPAKAAYTVKDVWVDHDYQVDVINFMATHTKRTRLIELQTGKGKTYCAWKAISRLGT